MRSMWIAAKAAELLVSLRTTSMVMLAAIIIIAIAPAHAASVPSDDEQEILIRTTLMTFNDANMTGNYSVLHAKASREVQAQLSVEQLFEAFKPFRTNRLFFEEIVYEDYDFMRMQSLTLTERWCSLVYSKRPISRSLTG